MASSQSGSLPSGRQNEGAQRANQRIIAEATEHAVRSLDLEQQGQLMEAARYKLLAADVLARNKGNYIEMTPFYNQLEGYERQYRAAAETLQQRANQTPPPAPGTAALGPAPGVQPATVLNAPVGGTKTTTDETFLVEKPNIQWSDVIGIEEAKAKLREAVEQPLLWPQLFGEGPLETWRGILMYGPPGTGKTMLAKAAASQVKASFFSINASDILHHYVGASERRIREVFQAAEKMAPSLIFIDECDNLLRKRSDKESEAVLRVKTEIFTAMSNFKPDSRVQVICATNVKDDLDEALMRRLERRVYVGPPNGQARAKMFAHAFSKIADSHALVKSDFEEFSRRTEFCTGSDIATIMKGSIQRARNRITTAKYFREDSNGDVVPAEPSDHQIFARPDDPSRLKVKLKVTAQDVIASIADNRPALSPEALKRYETQTDKY